MINNVVKNADIQQPFRASDKITSIKLFYDSINYSQISIYTAKFVDTSAKLFSLWHNYKIIFLKYSMLFL